MDTKETPATVPKIRTYADDVSRARQTHTPPAPLKSPADASATTDKRPMPTPPPVAPAAQSTTAPQANSAAGEKPAPEADAGNPPFHFIQASSPAETEVRNKDKRPLSLAIPNLAAGTPISEHKQSILTEEDQVFDIAANQTHEQGSIVTDMKRKRFRLFPAIIQSVRDWFETQQSNRAARQARRPKVTRSAARADVIKAAAAQSALAPRDDVRTISKRLQEVPRPAHQEADVMITDRADVPPPQWTYTANPEPQAMDASTATNADSPPPTNDPAAEAAASAAAKAAAAELSAELAGNTPPQPVIEVPPEPPAPAPPMDEKVQPPAPAAPAIPTELEETTPEPAVATVPEPEPAPEPPSAPAPIAPAVELPSSVEMVATEPAVTTSPVVEPPAAETAAEPTTPPRPAFIPPTAPRPLFAGGRSAQSAPPEAADTPVPAAPAFETDQPSNGTADPQPDEAADRWTTAATDEAAAPTPAAAPEPAAPAAPAGRWFQPTPDLPPDRRLPSVMAVMGAALVLVGGAAAWWFSGQSAAPEATTAIPATIEAGAQVPVLLGTRHEELLRSLQSAADAAGSGVTQLYPVSQTDAAAPPVAADEILAVLALQAPGNFQRTIESVTFGTLDGQAPFMILKVNSFDIGFSGLLAWEPTMSADLAPWFGEPVATTLDPAARTANRIRSAFFTDTTLGSRDVRLLYDETRTARLIYAFLDRSTVLLTTTPEAFATLAPLVR